MKIENQKISFPCITKYVLVGLKIQENSPWPHFLEDFISIKLNFLPKTSNWKIPMRKISKRDVNKKALCMQMTWWKLMHMYDEIGWGKFFFFVLLNLKHVKMIHFSTLHNHKKFVRASWNQAHSSAVISIK